MFSNFSNSFFSFDVLFQVFIKCSGKAFVYMYKNMYIYILENLWIFA